jgi:hypothetical protein
MKPNYIDLQNSEAYRIILALKHHEIVHFVRKYINCNSSFALFFRAFICFCLLIFLVTGTTLIYLFPEKWPIFVGNFLLGIFSFFLLVAPHELIHGIMYRFYGAKKVKYGVIWSKLAFYAIAPNFVVSKKEFIPLAIAPFLILNGIIIALLFLSISSPEWHCLLWGLFLTHSFGCIGDFAMMSFFDYHKTKKIYTFDEKNSGISYFYEAIAQTN